MNHSRGEKRTGGPSVKRKERDGSLEFLKPSPLTTKKLAKPSPHHRHPPLLSPKPSQQPQSNNHLLAGYLANEFLSKGTILGQPWDPAPSRIKPDPPIGRPMEPEKYVRYKEVAHLFKTDGAHIPGIINPTQLARFIM